MIRVLLVDDESFVREELMEACEFEGFTADTAASSEECLAKLAAAKASGTPFSAVILDLDLGDESDQSGDQIVPDIHRDYSFTTVIILTAHASYSTAISTLRKGAYQYLTKPTTPRTEVFPVLRAGVATNRLRRMRGELLTKGTADFQEDVEQVIQDAIPRRGKTSRFFLAVVSPRDGDLRIEIAPGAPDRVGDEIKRDHSLVKRVFGGRCPLHLRSTDQFDDVRPLQTDTQSLIAVPVPGFDKSPTGLVVLESPAEHAFDEHLEDVLSELAGLVALRHTVESHSRLLAEAKTAEDLTNTARELAHHIRNPVHVLRASFGLLEKAVNARPEDDELVREVRLHLAREVYCDEITEVVDRLFRIGQSIQLDKKETELNAELCRWAASYTQQLEQSEVQFDFAPDPGVVTVNADARYLERAVAVLIDNAVEACSTLESRQRRAAWVSLSLAADSGRVQIRVADSGPGVPAADEKRVFEPLFSTRGEHRGIGLFSARNIALKHDGELRLSPPAEGRGAEFVLELPLASLRLA